MAEAVVRTRTHPLALPGTFVAVVAALAVFNVAEALWIPSPLYVPVHLLAAAGLVWWMRRTGLEWDELGLDRRRFGNGLRYGLAAAAVVAVVLAVGAAIPAFDGFFADARVAGVGVAGLTYQTLVRIPLGTVVLEETAFRGVLLGLGMRRWGTTRAVVVSSVLFGLWHIMPAISALDLNGLAADATSRAVAVAGAVVATFIGGLIFCWLRLRSSSVLAPMLAHVGTNSIGFLVAYLLIT